MIIKYDNNEAKRRCEDANYAIKKLGKKPANNLQLLMTRLRLYKVYNLMYSEPICKRYNSHELKGDKKGIESLCIDHKYRMCLKIRKEKAEDGQDVITILEVSNHYED